MPTESTALACETRFSGVYEKLRAMARSRLRRHEAFTLLNTLDLVHECFLRLGSEAGVQGPEQASFLAYAGRVMRSVIVDAARTRLASRRGGKSQHVEYDEAVVMLVEIPAKQILEVHDAIDALYETDPRLAQVIELHYFAGMSDSEIGTCLQVSERTVRRDSNRAYMLLRALLS